jgi:hypothetical protein
MKLIRAMAWPTLDRTPNWHDPRVDKACDAIGFAWTEPAEVTLGKAAKDRGIGW